MEVEISVKSKDFTSGNFDSFTSKELVKVVNKLKINSSPGGDNIHNLFLKKLPFEYIKKVLLKLVKRKYSLTFLRHLIKSGLLDLYSTYLLRFVIDFLKNRKFRVKINSSLGELCQIECGVPQGSVLGPLLFLVFIQDVWL